MRTIFFFLFSVCLFSCGSDEEVIVLANYELKDGTTLLLQKKMGGYLGATTPSVTLISKKEKSGREQQVAKIRRWLDGGAISFETINDSLLNVRYIDAWHDTSAYVVNINQRIYPNDGSSYLEPKWAYHR